MKRSIDGSFTLTEDQLFELTLKAFLKTKLMPAKKWSSKKGCVSATTALIEAYGEFPQVTNEDWIYGFSLGFEEEDICDCCLGELVKVDGKDYCSFCGSTIEAEVDTTSLIGEFKAGYIMGKRISSRIFEHIYGKN